MDGLMEATFDGISEISTSSTVKEQTAMAEAPACANAYAICAPMPLLVPVMQTVNGGDNVPE